MELMSKPGGLPATYRPPPPTSASISTQLRHNSPVARSNSHYHSAAGRAMSRLEDITPGAAVRGLTPHGRVTVASVEWHGADVFTVVYRDGEGGCEVVTHGRPWSFDGDGATFRLVSEVRRTFVRTCSARCSRCSPQWSSRCRTRSPRSTGPCWRASRCVSCSRTIRRRQDHHGRIADEGTDRPRRPAAHRLNSDRFKGRVRDGSHTADVSDLMRRMVKEQMLKFDGTPPFPERMALTVTYRLCDAEAHLYGEVTEYVREEFNRAEGLHKRVPANKPDLEQQGAR